MKRVILQCRFRLWSIVTGFLLALTLIPTILAGNLDTRDFLEKSDLIFLGRMIDRESYPSRDGRFILTRYRFLVEHTLKGEHENLAEVVEYGGTIGDKTLYVSHSARYRDGGRYLLFARRDSKHRLRTLGGWEGSLEVLRGPQNQSLLRLFRTHPLSALFPADAPSGLMPLESAMESISARLKGKDESR